jgi:uncharacterized protein (TIGR02301 family)
MKKRNFTLGLAAAAMAMNTALSYAAGDMDYQSRHRELVTLAGIFGELHHIRRSCDPRREADTWRDRMKKLVDLEEPRDVARNEMVASFNEAYSNAQNRFAGCDRDARDHAARRASEGDAIVVRLMAPLYEAVSEDGDLPAVWRGTEAPVTEIRQ